MKTTLISFCEQMYIITKRKPGFKRYIDFQSINKLNKLLLLNKQIFHLIGLLYSFMFTWAVFYIYIVFDDSHCFDNMILPYDR